MFKKLSKKNRTIATLLCIMTTTLILTGCSIPQAEVMNDKSKASAAAPVEETTVPTPEPEVNEGILPFGQIMTWEDNVSISVSEPAPYAPQEWAAGVVEGQTHLVFTLVLTNNSDEVFDPSVFSTVSSGGVEASAIFDSGNPAGETTGGPTTPVLPGQTVKWLEAYSVADPAAITFQTAPSFSYEPVIFTNIAQ